ncbi:MAG: hypothetical protein QXL15_04595 [Candidatus Korarchaeota archaeon]
MKVHYDIPENMMINVRTFFSGRDYFVGTYYRVCEEDGEQCVQYILYYTKQLFRPHPYDYEPIFVYPDKIIYDKMHYTTGFAKNGWKSFTVIFPWNSITHHNILASRKLNMNLRPLTDKLVRTWWKIPGPGQFLIRQKLINPWRISRTFRDEIRCPVCGKLHLISQMNVNGSKLSWSSRCHGKLITILFDTEREEYKVLVNNY